MATTFERIRPDDYLERLAASGLGRASKSLVLAELGLSSGSVVVDLGCGPGADLERFAEAVGPSGSVLGLDVDEQAVALAVARVAHLPNVTVRTADIRDVALPDASVTHVHTDRVLQHVPEPDLVIAQAARILRPGGVAVFAEPDWDTLVVDHADGDLAATYRRFVVERVVRNARIGRQLPRRAEAAGLSVERAVPHTAVFRDAVAADQVLGLARVTEKAVAAGYLDRGTADGWLDDLAHTTFFASVTLFVTVARRPAP